MNLDQMIAAVAELPEEERRQTITNLRAVKHLLDEGASTSAEAMMDLMRQGCANASELADGTFEFSLTDKGLVQAASVVKRMAGDLQ